MATRKVKAREARREAQIDTASAYAVLAGESKRARTADRVEAFQALPTIFPGFNRASTVGGAPLSCVWLVHGPSMGGKTAFLCGLIASFQARGALAAFIDAEMSADLQRWFPALGVDVSRLLYVGRTSAEEDVEPLTYEEVVEEVDGLLKRYSVGRRDGSIIPGTPLLIVVDSISKMVPRDLLKSMEKDGGKALRSGVGRLQALLNTAWLAELGPKVGDAPVILAIVAHEMEGESRGTYTSFKVRGGGSLVYDSMVQVRVSYSGKVTDLSPKSEDDSSTEQTGKRHKVKVLKNKHGPAFGEAFFYTATGGGLAPMGFDPIREIVGEGLIREVLRSKGKFQRGAPPGLTLGTTIEWDGGKATLKRLYEDVELAAVIRARVLGDAGK